MSKVPVRASDYRVLSKFASLGFEEATKTISKRNLFASVHFNPFDLPFEEAIRYFRDKANVMTKHWYDVQNAAASRAFWVAGAASNALVDDFRQAIDKAISKGTTLDEFRKDFDQIVARHGWTGWKGEGSAAGRAWRTDIIYQTNLRAAYSAGRYAALTRAETLKAFPYWQYHHSGSLHPRRQHLAWDGLILRADDPFWATNYPPNGWHCGCYVTPVSQSELNAQGKTSPDQAPELLPVRQQIGNKTVTVPQGVDAGFAYNVGQAWLSRTAPGRETMAAAPGMIERFAEAVATGKLKNPGAYMPVALSSQEISAYFHVATGAEIRLVASRLKEHLDKHLVTTSTLYSKLIEHAVSEATILTDEMMRLMMITEFEGKKWIIGVRSKRGQLQVTSVHETSDKQMHTKIRRGNVLREGR